MTTFSITYSDGATNEISCFGNSEVPTEVMIILPAMGVWASYYKAFAERLITPNRLIYTADLRGQGKSSLRASKTVDWGYKDHVSDIKELIDTIRGKHNDVNIVLLGHSLGGQMACLYASRYKNTVSGLILIACCSVHYTGWDGLARWATRLAIYAFDKIARVLGYFPGQKVGFGGLQSKTEITDWTLTGLTGKYQPEHDTYDYEESMSEATTNLLAINIEGDTYSPIKATHNLTSRFISARSIKMEVIGESHKLDHFTWAKHPGLFKDLIDNWIQKIIVNGNL